MTVVFIFLCLPPIATLLIPLTQFHFFFPWNFLPLTRLTDWLCFFLLSVFPCQNVSLMSAGILDLFNDLSQALRGYPITYILGKYLFNDEWMFERSYWCYLVIISHFVLFQHSWQHLLEKSCLIYSSQNCLECSILVLAPPPPFIPACPKWSLFFFFFY